MAINPADPNRNSEALIRDAEEALQRERLAAFWRDNGGTILAAVLMLVLGTAAGSAWKAWKAHQNEQNTVLYAAVADGTSADLAALSGPQAAMARLTAAQKDLAATGKDAGVFETVRKYYGDIAADKAAGEPWQDLGRWNALRLSMDDEKADAAKLVADFEALARDMKSSGFAALPLIDAAVVAGERMGDRNKAYDLLKRAGDEAPRGTSAATLVDDLKHLYAIQGRQEKAAAPKADDANAEKK